MNNNRRTQPEERLEVVLEKGICYSYHTSDSTGGIFYKLNFKVTMICDEEYPRRVAVDLLYKIMQNFQDYYFKNQINMQSIKKDTSLKFTFIDTIISEWQNPVESK